MWIIGKKNKKQKTKTKIKTKQTTTTKKKPVIEMVYMNLSDFINENIGDKIWKELKLITPFWRT